MEEYSRIIYDQSNNKIRAVTLEGLSGSGKSTHKYQLDKFLVDRCFKTKLGLKKRVLKATVEGMALALKEYVKLLEMALKKDDHKIVLSEGGFSSIIVTCLSRRTHSVAELEKIFFDVTSKITEIHNKYGYLEIILVPEHINIIKERSKGIEISDEEIIKQQELIQGFQLFKSTKWGNAFDSELIEIKKEDTILSVNEKITLALSKYNLMP